MPFVGDPPHRRFRLLRAAALDGRPTAPGAREATAGPGAAGEAPAPGAARAVGAGGAVGSGSAAGPRGAGVGRRPGGWLATPDGRAVSLLVVLPLLFFVIPAVLGRPVITGDNLIQNFPLRALSGEQMRQGHLPLWDPYIWSGSPLLGGLNAGSFYPFTFVFAVLPPVGAWVFNLVGVYWAGGLGLYALARQYRLRPLPSLLGALTYAFSGAMSGQIVHIGVIQGMGWVPLLVLAELRLSWAVLRTGPVTGKDALATSAIGPASGAGSAGAGSVGAAAGAGAGSSPWPWVALLGLVIGLEALTGEPRSMAETEIVAPAVALWLVLRPYGGRVAPWRRLAFVGWAALAAVWGTALAAAELAPGWSFIQASQRAAESYRFFGSGSLPVKWSALLFVPDLFGGVGRWGQPRYFTHYNLPEVTGYVGLLPLAAALVLLTRSFGRRRSALAADWGMWLALVVLGLFLAWGYYTPLGHVWAQIPLFGRTRLQSRNLGIVDLALAVLLAFWADRLLAWRPAIPLSAAADPGGTGTSGWRRWAAVAPPAAAVVLCAAALIGPVAFGTFFGETVRGAALARGLWPWFLGEGAVAAGLAALVWRWRRWRPQTQRRWIAALVVADVALFVLATSTGTAQPDVAVEPTHAAAAAVLGSRGRFAIYDTTATNVDEATYIGQPDLNVFTRLPSVQGYGSIVSSAYGGPTGTHTLDTLSPCALVSGTFHELRLATLAVLPSELAPGVGPSGKAPAPTVCAGAPQPGTAERRTLYLGWSVALSGATLARSRPTSAVPRVGVVTAGGHTRFPRETVRPTPGGWSVRFPEPVVAAGLVVEGPARAVSSTSTVTGAAGGRWALDGPAQDALDRSGWRFTGGWHMYGIFERTTVLPPVWVAPGAPGSTARQLRATDWGTTVDAVVATRPTTVVWSEEYLPGWHAELSPAAGGPSRALAVHPYGLVQAARVPAGRWTLRFVYRPRYLTLGIVGSLAAVAGFALLGVAAAVGRRRRRHRHGRARQAGAPAGAPTAASTAARPVDPVA